VRSLPRGGPQDQLDDVGDRDAGLARHEVEQRVEVGDDLAEQREEAARHEVVDDRAELELIRDLSQQRLEFLADDVRRVGQFDGEGLRRLTGEADDAHPAAWAGTIPWRIASAAASDSHIPASGGRHCSRASGAASPRISASSGTAGDTVLNVSGRTSRASMSAWVASVPALR
jgi:hypothetical protein